MPVFSYIAVAADGGEQRGTIEAPDADAVVVHLRARQLFPLELSPARTTPTARSAMQRFGSGVPGRYVAAFTRQLATLLRAGIPLHRSLIVLQKQERNPALRTVIGELAAGVEAGRPLSESLGAHPRVFEPLQINLVRAGESAGALDAVLERLALFQERRIQTAQKLRAAMVYPATVLTVAVGILAALLTFVVPKFAQVFADLLKGAPLPALTRAVLAASYAVRDHAAAIVAVVAAAIALTVILCRTPPGRAFADELVLKVPLLGRLTLRAVLVRFTRTLGTLLGSGVPVLQALAIARETCGNTKVSRAVGEVRAAVEAGSPLAAPLEATGVFPSLVSSMVEVGEQSGQLPEMLAKVAEMQEGELDAAVAGLSALLEPALIVFLAVVVGTIVIALFLPIVRIVELLT